MTAPEKLIQHFQSKDYGSIGYRDKRASQPSQKPLMKDIVLVGASIKKLSRPEKSELTKEIIADMISSDSREETVEVINTIRVE